MGNSTSVPIDEYFEGELNLSKKETYKAIVYLSDKESFIFESDEETHATSKIGSGGESPPGEATISKVEAGEYEIEWMPKSHMRDFEVINAFEPEEVQIARGQGICVVIMEPFRSYFKFYYDDDAIGCHNMGPWEHDSKCKSILEADLAIGYDVLIVTQEHKLHRLCDPVGKQDASEIVVFAPGLDSSLTKFERNKRKRDSTDK